MSVFHLARWHLMSEVSQDWQMYILAVIFELLSDFKGSHTNTHGHHTLLDSSFLLYGVIMSFSVIPLNTNTHTQALSSPSHVLLIETVAPRWLGAVTALCLVGSCRHLEPHMFEDYVETKPAL